MPPRLSHFSAIFENEVLVDFVDFGWLDMLDIAYCYRWQWYIATNGGQGADKSILKPRFGPLWSNFAPKMAKIEILGHFIEFGSWDWPDFAYFDSTKQSSRFRHGISHVLHNQLCRIKHNLCKVEPKMKFYPCYGVWFVRLVWYCIFW